MFFIDLFVLQTILAYNEPNQPEQANMSPLEVNKINSLQVFGYLSLKAALMAVELAPSSTPKIL